MSAQAIIKIGPHGGKIVGYQDGKPVYQHDVAPGHPLHLPTQPGDGTPITSAMHHPGLRVGVHPTQHDKVQVAWKTGDPAAVAWLDLHPLPTGAKVVETSTGHSLVVVPKTWASTPAAWHVPAAAPAAPAAPVTKPAPAAAPPPKPATAAAPAPSPAASDVPAVLTKAGATLADKSTLKVLAKDWKDSPGHPVTVNGKVGELVGWQTSGKPPIKTGKLCVRFPGPGKLGGKLATFEPSEVKPDLAVPLKGPWSHPDVKVWKFPAAAAVIEAITAEKVVGLPLTFQQVFDEMNKAGVPPLVVGGFVRDALRGETSKDVDMGYQGDCQQVQNLAIKKGWMMTPAAGGGLVTLGDKSAAGEPLWLEGKAFYGPNSDAQPLDPSAPTWTGSDLHDDLVTRDFACNSLWYDPQNKVFIDPHGKGAEDSLNHVLRIPVDTPRWGDWLAGNPSKVARYWKFRARGWKPADEETRAFIVDGAKKMANGPGGSDYMNKAFLWKGIMSSKADKDHFEKVKKFKAAVVADMGAAWFDKHYGKHYAALAKDAGVKP